MIDKILKDIKGLFKVQDKAKFLKQNIPYLAFFYVGNIFSHHVRAYTGGDVIDKIFQGILELNTMSLLPSIHVADILMGVGVAALIKFIVYTKGKNAKKFRQGKEYGSARWGTRKDIEPYMDEKFQNNILLTQTERLTMNGRPANPKYARNKNVLVIGGGDTGNDCVGSAIRLGCKAVIQLEMMPEPPHERLDSNPWPEWPRVKKTDYGQNESIAVFGHDPRLYQTTVKEFIKDDKGNVKQVVIVSLESKQVEGCMQMVPVKGSEKTLDADIVLIAAGFVGCEDYVAKAFDVKLTPRGNVADENYQTNQKQLYVAGDMRRGQSLVVWAIREGREVARAVDEDLMGYSNL